MDEKLYLVIDYILNHAQDRDIDVILKAVKKRYDRKQAGGGLNPDARGMARDMAAQIQEQVGFSRDQIRQTVRDLSADIIRKNAPELNEDQIEELLGAWVPDPDKAGPRFPPVPRDALTTMVDQFLRYSTGSMSATEQMRLEHEIPGWTERYWERFPRDLRQIIEVYLKGKLDEEEFRRELHLCLEEAPE
jgi:hypothetical protein